MNATARRVILIDSQRLYRECLKEVLNRSESYRVVADSDKGESGINAVKTVEADIVLLDLAPSVSGYDSLKTVRRATKEKIMVLSMEKESDSIHKMFEMGADGFCLKDASLPDLMGVLDGAIDGKHPICIEPPKSKPAVCDI